MQLPTEKPIEKIIKQSNNSLAHLINRSKQFNQLTNFVKQFIAVELQPHCRVYDYKNNCLILATASSHWHLRLSYEVPNLLSHLRTNKGLYDLASIKIIVQPENNLIETQNNNKLKIERKFSSDSANLIKDTARSISDPNLKQQLLSLANFIAE